MVEVAKALSQKARIIVMDEPTSPLTDKETGNLFKTIRKLKQEGVSVIYISHRLEEVKEIADRATIMRDGCTICTVNVKDVSIRDIIRFMVGRELTEQYPKVETKIGGAVFRAENITRKGVLENVSFEARAGEVLGICGLVRAGRTETARAIFGVDPRDSGRIYVDGSEVRIRKTKDAINAGIGFVTEDRKSEGLVLCRDCKENISLVALRNFEKIIHVNLASEKAACRDYAAKLNVKTPSLSQKVSNLSGGNQQKIVLAKWLMSDARVLILDEPTRGIDVGAKVEVYNIINDIVKHGKTVIMISSEMTELMGMCDRIIVMCRGKVTGELERKEFSQASLMYLAAGGDEFIKG
jgi:ribose transport system ATP-binding protein